MAAATSSPPRTRDVSSPDTSPTPPGLARSSHDTYLAPESPFPSAVEDAATDYRWLMEEGHRPERIIIVGDSSAGGLSVATILKLREDGTPLPAGGVSISPVGGFGLHRPDARDERRSGSHGDQGQPDAHGWPVPQRRGPAHPARPPLYADHSGLPPLLKVVGGDEELLDDSVGLARAAGIAGVDVTLYIGAGMQHIFPIYCGVMPEADAVVAMIGAWMRART